MLGVKSTIDTDSAFIATTYDRTSTRFSYSSLSRLYTIATYLTEEGTIEDLRPCAFIPKLQTHDLDDLTYEDILRGFEEDK